MGGRARYQKILIVTWLALVLYWPVFEVAGKHMRLDYPLTAILAIWFVTQKWNSGTQVALSIALFYMFLLIVATFNGISLGYSVSLVQLAGIMRFFLLIAIWTQILRVIPGDYILRILPVVAIPSAFFAILQILAPQAVGSLTIAWYSAPAHAPTAGLWGADGSYDRAVSVFRSPVYLAYASLIWVVFACGSAEIVHRVKLKIIYYGLAVLHAVAGLLTGSKTFIVGFAIVLVLLVGWSFAVRNSKSWPYILAVSLGSVLGITWVGSGDLGLWVSGEMRYQITTVMQGALFDTRLGSEGALTQALRHWEEWFPIGIGAVSYPYPTNDNLFIASAARFGVVGVAVMIGALIMATLKCVISRREPYTYAVTAAVILVVAVGMATSTLIKPRLTEIVAYCLAAVLVATLNHRHGVNRVSPNGASSTRAKPV